MKFLNFIKNNYLLIIGYIFSNVFTLSISVAALVLLYMSTWDTTFQEPRIVESNNELGLGLIFLAFTVWLLIFFVLIIRKGVKTTFKFLLLSPGVWFLGYLLANLVIAAIV